MSSQLGPTFANFYMAHLENRVLNALDVKPKIYCRFVDDIYTDAKLKLLLEIKKSMEEHSALRFTSDLSKDNKLPFIDILTHYDITALLHQVCTSNNQMQESL